MKTKRHIIALVVTLALVIVAAFCVGCGNNNPKSYSFTGTLQAEGGREWPAFLELKEDGSVQLEYIMMMGQADNTTHTTVTNQGSWTQDSNGKITSVKLISNGETYDAVIDATGSTITIGYSLDFATFTVSVAEVKTGEGAKNFVFNTTASNE